MVKVKICGITNEKDAVWSVNYGTDYIGLNFFTGSPRKVSLAKAKTILSQVPPFITPVGVFVDEPIESIVTTVLKLSLPIVQLHGSEPVEYCTQLKNRVCTQIPNFKLIKTFKIQTEPDLTNLVPYLDYIDFILLDTYVPDLAGGTGTVFNWDLAVKAKQYNKPLFLAGGLTPENVRDAIVKVNPYAVDVASGVERLPRRKDYDKLRQFISTVKKI